MNKGVVIEFDIDRYLLMFSVCGRPQMGGGYPDFCGTEKAASTATAAPAEPAPCGGSTAFRVSRSLVTIMCVSD